MNTCEHCEHFDDAFETFYGCCEHPKMFVHREIMTVDGVELGDTETSVYVGKEFGCLHWQRKQESE